MKNHLPKLPIHVCFTGSQKGMTTRQCDSLIILLSGLGNDVMFMHGDCVGADEEAHKIVQAKFPQFMIHIFPSNIEKKRAYCKGARQVCNPLPPLVRNKHMARFANLTIAAPYTSKEQSRSGTWATVRYSRKNRPCCIVILEP